VNLRSTAKVADQAIKRFCVKSSSPSKSNHLRDLYVYNNTMKVAKERNTSPSPANSDIECGFKACREGESSQNIQSNHHAYADEESKNTNVPVSDERGDAAESGSINDGGSLVSTMRHNLFNRLDRTIVFCILILILGAAASAAFIFVGVSSVHEKENEYFNNRASETVNHIDHAWKSYETSGLYVHETCREGCTRRKFREVYEYIVSTGLEFQVISYNPNTTTEERPALEEESRTFYEHYYPDLVNYTGVKGLEPDPEQDGSLKVQDRSEQPFYFPVHYLEPVEGNVDAIDFDLHSSPSRRVTINTALSTWKPALTPRLSLVQETEEDVYSVILMHPGVPLSTQPDLRPKDFSSVVIRTPDLLKLATKSQAQNTIVYIYDSTEEPPVFLGGATVTVNPDSTTKFENRPEISLAELRRGTSGKTLRRESVLSIASREWRVVVVAPDGTYEGKIGLLIIGGLLIFVACTCLALWLFTYIRRTKKLDLMQSEADAEKAAVVIESAKKAARRERNLNDFIAHEVRNPLSAAMSACAFVSAAINDETKPLTEKVNRQHVNEDVHIIDSSLHFINDLLRNMLDMHRASSKQLQIEYAPTDILLDVLMPINAMLYTRGSGVKVQIDCPENLVVRSDRLRLKQIVLNLARNANKFVEKGFIRLRTELVNGNVRILVEDSGPGIPLEHREKLFSKFQESLDSLNQGTGIGLSLCKELTRLMNGSVWFDDSYISEVEGCPGSRFVVDLCVSPDENTETTFENSSFSRQVSSRSTDSAGASTIGNGHASAIRIESASASPESSDKADGEQQNDSSPLLPENLSVLFVDDDLMLRKLFIRGVKTAAPTWKVQQAANGETALSLVDSEPPFDMIFMDQYMASVEKQLLGTETTRALRSKGVTARICGLSANDVEESFYEAGANSFMLKPFPCKKEHLIRELHRILNEERPALANGNGE
jgi:signal transduction histidine kinase/CheY-like chemotaxis protein